MPRAPREVLRRGLRWLGWACGVLVLMGGCGRKTGGPAPAPPPPAVQVDPPPGEPRPAEPPRPAPARAARGPRAFPGLGLGSLGRGRGGGSGISYKKRTTYTFEEDQVQGNLLRPDFSFRPPERYPTMECPDAVAPLQDFAVQVSLTEEELTPEARVAQGETTPEGRVVLPLPPSEAKAWTLDVVLSSPGLEFPQGGNLGRLVLPEKGDSSVALFKVRAKAIPGAEKTVRILATLWHDGTFLARLERPVQVRTPGTLAQGGPARAVPEVGSAAPRAKGGSLAVQGEASLLQMGYLSPDLTVLVLGGEEADTLILQSPHLQPAQFTVPKPAGLGPWLEAQYRLIRARTGRGQQVEGEDAPVGPDRAATEAFLRGFGRQLYARFAPEPFKAAYWKVKAELKGPLAIQILTDDPALPWELMRPVRPDGSEEAEFLGLEAAVARWHLGRTTAQLPRPPQALKLETLAVVAPHYGGAAALPALEEERAALGRHAGYRAVGGSLQGMRTLSQALPQGIVHFAGHGQVSRTGAIPEFAILLEDGPLDLMTWRGMAPEQPERHPLFFFNACEVGQSERVATFVDGWAPAVLEYGASGYIGALWPVSDRVAGTFAVRFYARLAENLTHGYAKVAEVLMRTRREVYRETGDPTALGYVFYGDPNLFCYGGRR